MGLELKSLLYLKGFKSMKNQFVFVFLLAVLCGCGGSSGSSGIGSSSNTTASFGNPTTPPDPVLVSQVDSSETVNAVAQGLDPTTTLISTNFYCYGEMEEVVEQPFTTISVSGNSFTYSSGSESGSGTILSRDGQVDFIDTEDPFTLTLEFNEHGQVLTVDDVGCYQEGAAHEAALHGFMLNTPNTGEFACQFSAEINVSSIALLDGNRYQVNGQVGTYQSSGVFTYDWSDIGFTTGPLQDAEAEYFEFPDSGLQVIAFPSAGECKRQSEPKPYKRYGSQSAPPAATPQRPLSGLYYVDTSSLTSTTRDDSASYVEFKPSGYMRAGLPLPGGTNCSLTQPNGLPICFQYQFDGQLFTVAASWGETFNLPLTVAGDGSVQTYDSYRTELVTPIAPASIVGSWESQNVESSSVELCIVGFCSGSISDRVLHFRADGRYLIESGSESFSSANLPDLSTFTSGSDSDAGTGLYRIIGTQIELTDNDGQIVEWPVHLTQSGRLVIGEVQYYAQ